MTLTVGMAQEAMRPEPRAPEFPEPIQFRWMGGEQPPAPENGHRDQGPWQAVTEQLRARPGEWADLGERPAHVRDLLRKRGCQVTVRRVANTTKLVHVYARVPLDGPALDRRMSAKAETASNGAHR